MFVIKQPLITEKSYKLAQTQRVYTFEVAPLSTKGQIKEAVQDTFGVTVLSVTTSKIAGKTKRTGKKRVASLSRNRKKAMVKIKEGQTIEIFEINQEATE